jgi:hypothetical protein
MEQNIVNGLWIGSELSEVESLCIRSWINQGYEFHLYCYDRIKGIPEGTVVKDANEIISEKKIFTTIRGSYAHFADWFRWTLLYNNGGIWSDMDVVCIKQLPHLSVIFAPEKDGLYNTSVLGFPAKHAVSKLMMEVSANPNKILRYDSFKRKVKKRFRSILGLFVEKKQLVVWGEASGPTGFTNAINYFGISSVALRIDNIYPLRSKNWLDTFETEAFLPVLEDAFCVHLWNELIRINKYDILRRREDCLFNYLLDINK